MSACSDYSSSAASTPSSNDQRGVLTSGVGEGATILRANLPCNFRPLLLFDLDDVDEVLAFAFNQFQL